MAFPDNKNFPAELSELPADGAISLLVAFKFADPIVAVGGRNTASPSAAMLVPKTTVDEDDFSSRGKDEVWLAREIVSVQSETIPH